MEEGGGAIEAPALGDEQVVRLANRCYDIGEKDIEQIQALDSYDDKNYWLRCARGAAGAGHVLKVTNRAEAMCDGLADAQCSLMAHVRSAGGVPAPAVVPRRDGRLSGVEAMPNGSRLPVRMIDYVVGELLVDVAFTPAVLYEVGALAGRFALAAATFRHAAYDSYRPAWSMDRLEEIVPLIDYVKDEGQKQLIKEGLELYRRRHAAAEKSLRQSLIHSDFNEANIIMEKDDKGAYKIAALLDFGDAHCAPAIFEVSNAILYMMIGSFKHGARCAAPLVGGHVLAGYVTAVGGADTPLAFTDAELLFARAAMAGRLCMSLVYGRYFHELRPRGYVLKTQALGWQTLRTLIDASDSELLRGWADVARQCYGIGGLCPTGR